MTSARVLLALVLAGLAASGCGLKGPLYLPEKSEVTIRPAPTPPAEPATPAPEQTTPEQGPPEQPASPEQPPQDPPPGPDRG